MTGPQHYAEAEALIKERHNCRAEENPCRFCVAAIAEAQVHATLAAAAAWIDSLGVGPQKERDEWDRATGRLEVTPLCGPT